MLTPFEKNLEVWRQLWRVLERSDIVVQVGAAAAVLGALLAASAVAAVFPGTVHRVSARPRPRHQRHRLCACVQVVDARDPLTYRSEDLESYCLALHPTKRTLLLLNKADLLPAALRSAWADHFDALGQDYVFWSAKTGMDEVSPGG